MPTASNWGYFIYVNLAFLILIALVFYYSQVDEIKKDWPKYRCNPLYMPLSDNMSQDFQYCIQNTQMNFMGYILQPLTFMTSNFNQNAGAFMGQINDIRAMFDKVRTFLSDTIQSIFGVFLNLVIEFQKITISIKDLMGKTIGVLATVLFMLDGSIRTMGSLNNGPPGQMLRSMGKCFHPDTRIALKDGIEMPIQYIHIGDVLKTGERVLGTMQFSNKETDEGYEPLYKLGKIYVTGSHFVYDTEHDKFVEIKDFAKALPQDEVKSDILICLITDTHKIHIGDYTFWDYEDLVLRQAIDKSALI